MSKNIIEIALKAGFINTSNGLESPFIEGEDLTDNLKLFASLLLAQPDHIVDVGNMVEQEPVAWCQMVEGNVQDLLTSFEMKDWLYDKSWIPLYTAPPKREPLSDKKLKTIAVEDEFLFYCNEDEFIEIARALEKAHGIGEDDE
jgi:hypothetical protein